MKSKKAHAEQVAKLMTLARDHPDGEDGAAPALLDAAAMVALEAGLSVDDACDRLSMTFRGSDEARNTVRSSLPVKH